MGETVGGLEDEDEAESNDEVDNRELELDSMLVGSGAEVAGVCEDDELLEDSEIDSVESVDVEIVEDSVNEAVSEELDELEVTI